MGYNKLVINSQTKFDLTLDTVAPEVLLQGATAHDNKGESIIGVIPHNTTEDIIVSEDNTYLTIPKGYYSEDITIELTYEPPESEIPENAVGRLNVGDKVSIGSLEFIVVNQGNPDPDKYINADGTWLLPTVSYGDITWQADEAVYDGCMVDQYIELNYMVNTLGSTITNALLEVKVPMNTATTVNSGENGFSTKCFILSPRELGIDETVASGLPEDGVALEYFKNSASNNSIRIAKILPSNQVFPYFTRTVSGSSNVWVIAANGAAQTVARGTYSLGIRPCMVLPKTYVIQ